MNGLKLNKETIAKLNDEQMNGVKGGQFFTIGKRCKRTKHNDCCGTVKIRIISLIKGTFEISFRMYPLIKYSMKKILIILIFISSTSFANNFTSKNVSTYCKVWGVCKYYANNNVDWDKVFFNDYSSLLKTKNNKDLNLLLYQLIKQTDMKAYELADTTINSASLIKNDWKLNTKRHTYLLKTDFSWIATSKNISTKNKQYLVSLIVSFKGGKPKTIKSPILSQLIYSKELTYKKFKKK